MRRSLALAERAATVAALTLSTSNAGTLSSVAAQSPATRPAVEANERAAEMPALLASCCWLGCEERRTVTEFEIYRRERSPVAKAPAVTLTHRGQLSLNEPAYTALGSPEAVELMYSRSNRLIGIRPVDPGEPHAYKPRTATKNNGHGPHVVSGSAFMNFFGIQPDQTRRYSVTVEDGILTIDLKKPGDPLTSSQTGRAKRGRGATGSW
jgi:hypothetical protein